MIYAERAGFNSGPIICFKLVVLQSTLLFIGVEAGPGDDINHTSLRHNKIITPIHFGFRYIIVKQTRNEVRFMQRMSAQPNGLAPIRTHEVEHK